MAGQTNVPRFLSCLLTLIFFILVGCQEDELEAETEIADNEQEVFAKLDAINTAVAQVYPEYNLQLYPSYLVLNKDEGGQAGFILNKSGGLPPGSIKVKEGQSANFTAHQFNDQGYLTTLNTELPDPAFFTYDFPIENDLYFALKEKPEDFFSFYDSYKDVDNNWVPLAFTHELFHYHQETNWVKPPNGFQAFNDFPLTEETIYYYLVLWDLASEGFAVVNALEREKKLKQLLAVFDKLTDIDTSPNDVIENYSGFQMWLEGSARHVEHFAAAGSIYPTISDDPSHGWSSFVNSLSTGQPIRSVFATRMWYHVGACMIELLKQLGHEPYAKLQLGKTPPQIVREAMPLSSTEQTDLLNEIASTINEAGYRERAAYLYSLL